MKGSTIVSDDGDNNAAAVSTEENHNNVASSTSEEEVSSLDQGITTNLVDTSLLTRRLARGEYTQSIARKITEQEEVGAMMLPPSAEVTSSSMISEASFKPFPRGSDVTSSISEVVNQSTTLLELSNVNNVPPPSLHSGSSISNNSNKSAFSDYISFFFKNAENYEDMLERSENQRDLKASMDRQRHGLPRFASPEEGDDNDDVVMEEISRQGSSIEHTGLQQRSSTPKLSDSLEAMAAVEAISNFRSLKEVKKEIMDRGSTSKKLKIIDTNIVGEEDPSPCDTDVDIDIRQSWDSFCSEKKKNKFNEVGFESILIPVSVDDFYELVLQDNADNSIEKFMRNIGELEVESTSWQPSSPTSTQLAKRRFIQYIHPINAPMAPPTAAARKEQSLDKFGNVGLCLETCTFVENVPMADCFVVRDRLWVNANPEEKSGCIVSVTFHIDFIKGTMFRRIIENTTRGEYQKFWTKFCAMIKSNLGSTTELDEVVIELEEAATLLEGEGQEVPLSSVLGRIRSSSRRLSIVARRASVRNVNSASVKVESSILFVVIGKGKVVLLELFTIVKQHFADKDDSYVLGCFVILLLGICNIMALRQISAMNRSITILTSQINDAILTSGEICLMN